MDVTPPRQARGKLMVVGALAAMTAVSALVAVSVVHFSKAPPPTATPAVEKESLTISASPREAKISLDDAALTGNPATLSLPRDGTSHHVRAEALGYVTKTQLVTADTALTTVDLSLERSPEPTASAAPSAVTSAFLPLAEVPVSAPRTGKGNAPVTGAHTISTAHTVQPTAAPPTTTTPTAAPPAASTSGIYMDPWKH